MTCFWDGLMKGLGPIMGQRRAREQLIQDCRKVRSFGDVRVLENNRLIPISKRMTQEFIDHMAELKINQIQNGYWCSTCDPFLAAVSQIYRIDIVHKYLGTTLLYNNVKAKKRMIVSSNRGHFQCIQVAK